MKTAVLSTVFLLVFCSVILAQETHPIMNYTLPKNDGHYRRVKDWIEDSIDVDYKHPSSAAIEAFRDIKYSVRIHWGLYTITEQGGESWPFLKLSKEKKQAYQELYKTWNPSGFNAEE